jgi:hypothetical protein
MGTRTLIDAQYVLRDLLNALSYVPSVRRARLEFHNQQVERGEGSVFVLH